MEIPAAYVSTAYARGGRSCGFCSMRFGYLNLSRRCPRARGREAQRVPKHFVHLNLMLWFTWFVCNKRCLYIGTNKLVWIKCTSFCCWLQPQNVGVSSVSGSSEVGLAPTNAPSISKSPSPGVTRSAQDRVCSFVSARKVWVCAVDCEIEVQTEEYKVAVRAVSFAPVILWLWFFLCRVVMSELLIPPLKLAGLYDLIKKA